MAHTISYHLKNVFADHELQEDSVIRNFRITADDGKTYDTQHYNLDANPPEWPDGSNQRRPNP